MSRRWIAAGVLLVGLVGPARADAFLVKGGGRVLGHLDKEFKDDYGARWLRIRTSFGQVDLRKKDLKKHVKSRRESGTLYLDEARVFGLAGTVEKSDDDGKSWTKIPWKTGTGETTDVTGFPPTLAPGEILRTKEKSAAELDIGWGVVHVDAESELTFRASKGATMKLIRGRAGVRIDETPKREAFRVETPQASMGIRGTTFVVEVADTTRLAVGEGTVRVGETNVAGGDAVAVGADGVPESVELTERDQSLLDQVDAAPSFPRLSWSVIPGGQCEMGGTTRVRTGPYVLSSEPKQKVNVGSFMMAQHEFTRGDFQTYSDWEQRFQGVVVPPVDQRTFRGIANPVPRSADAPYEDTEPMGANFWMAGTISRWMGGDVPSEAQWEHAARGGKKSDCYWGDDPTKLGEYEWTPLNSGDRELTRTQRRTPALTESNRMRTRPVGTKKANPFGLFDMMGNAREWCQDVPVEGLDGIPQDGSPRTGPDNGHRVCKGGDAVAGPLAEVFHRGKYQTMQGHGVRIVRALRSE